MPITSTQLLAIGNAVRLGIAPAIGTLNWTVLRNLTGTFSGYNDPAASVIMSGTDLSVLDTQALVNGTTYYYGLFVFDGSAWHADGVVTAVPAASFTQTGPDVLSIIRDRLDAGLLVYLLNGALVNANNHIQVLTAPPLYADTIWPVVTVHLQSEGAADRAIGDISQSSSIGSDGQWDEFSGLLTSSQILIVAWCLNPDERIALRRAIKGVLIGNLPVFEDAGMLQIDFTQSDTEDFQSFGAPVYQTMTTLTCLAPSSVQSTPAGTIQQSINIGVTIGADVLPVNVGARRT